MNTELAALAASLPQAQAVTSLEQLQPLVASGAYVFVHDGTMMAIPWEILLVLIRFVLQLLGINIPI